MYRLMSQYNILYKKLILRKWKAEIINSTCFHYNSIDKVLFFYDAFLHMLHAPSIVTRVCSQNWVIKLNWLARFWRLWKSAGNNSIKFRPLNRKTISESTVKQIYELMGKFNLRNRAKACSTLRICNSNLTFGISNVWIYFLPYFVFIKMLRLWVFFRCFYCQVSRD